MCFPWEQFLLGPWCCSNPPCAMVEASATAALLANFKKVHEWTRGSSFMAHESTQVAIASLVAEENTTAVSPDAKYFDNKDVSAVQLNLATILQIKELKLPQVIRCNGSTFQVVIAVKSCAIMEAIYLFNKITAQYSDVLLKMVAFTGRELRLGEGKISCGKSYHSWLRPSLF